MWSFFVNDFKYAYKDLSPDNGIKMQAIVDSSNSTIQIPQTQYEQMRKQMMLGDPTIEERKIEGFTQLVSKRPCAEA